MLWGLLIIGAVELLVVVAIRWLFDLWAVLLDDHLLMVLLLTK